VLVETSPDEVPKEIKFHLEIYFWRAHQVPYQKSTVMDHCPPSSNCSGLAKQQQQEAEPREFDVKSTSNFPAGLDLA
jgi:hypothetical protein